VDVVTAGFPCQPFSNAGSRKGKSDSRGTLFENALQVVSWTRPKVVLFENVRGILSFKSGKDKLVGEICGRLEDLGYTTSFALLNASMHNVPQKRLRVFIAGVRSDMGIPCFDFPTQIQRDDLTLGHVLQGVTDSIPNQLELMSLNPQAVRLGAFVPEGGSWKDIPTEELPERLKKIRADMRRYRWPNFYRRFGRYEISGTITAAFKPENAGVWHPIDDRVLSVREVGRIQSFPDWFVFEGSNIKSKYQQIGNAVPPRLAYELGLAVRALLNGDTTCAPQREVVRYEDWVQSGKPLRPLNIQILR
jgi:DNA (cytosine-5)-methyltransferase 1